MKQINDFIQEKLRITKNINIQKEISTFEDLKEKYGDPNKNSKKINKHDDLIIVDNKYREQLSNIFTMWGEWDKFYKKFKDNYSFYIDSNLEEDFDVIIEHRHHGNTKLICRKWKENTNVPEELGYLNLVYNTDAGTQFELQYELINHYINNTEEILVRAFDYLVNMK